MSAGGRCHAGLAVGVCGESAVDPGIEARAALWWPAAGLGSHARVRARRDHSAHASHAIASGPQPCPPRCPAPAHACGPGGPSGPGREGDAGARPPLGAGEDGSCLGSQSQVALGTVHEDGLRLGPGAACPAPAPWRKWPERRIHAGFWAEGQRPGRPEMEESGGGDGGAGAGHAARASGPPQPPARCHRRSCLNRAQDTAGCQRPPEARGPGPGSSTSQPERSPTGGARTTDTPCPQPRRPEPKAWVGAPPRPRPRARGQRRLLCPPRPSLGVCLSLSPRMGTRSQGIGPTPVTPFHLSPPRSHSGILGVRAPIYEFWGHNAARDMAAQHTFGVLQR